MRHIRLLIGDVSDDVRKRILSATQLDPDVDLVGCARGTFEMLLRTGATRADVLVTALREDGGEPGVVSHVIGEYPEVIVVALGPHFDRASIFRLVGPSEDVSAADPDELWHLVRSRLEMRS